MTSQLLEYADCHQIAERQNCAGTGGQLVNAGGDSGPALECEIVVHHRGLNAGLSKYRTNAG